MRGCIECDWLQVVIAVDREWEYFCKQTGDKIENTLTILPTCPLEVGEGI